MRDPLGAFCSDQDVYIEGRAGGLLSGLNFAAKDVFDIAGFRTGAGNPDWLRTHPPANSTASAVQHLLNAGATLVGKTHTDELTFSINGENYHYGTPVNPTAPGRIPGGSSSGSASAVAGELVDFSLGTDTGGSVRLPASNCGIFGFRPTHGRVANDGVVPLSPSFDTVGWFARTGELLQRVGAVLLDTDEAEPGFIRFLLAGDAMQLVSEEVRPALDDAVAILDQAPGHFEAVDIYNGKAEEWMTAFRTLQGAEVWKTHGEWIREAQPEFGPEIRARFEWAASVDTRLVPAASALRSEVAQILADLLGQHSVLCIPTSPSIALPQNLGGEQLEQFRQNALALLCVAGLAGLPQVSLPLGLYDSCPLGISLIGPRNSDSRLLALTASIRAS
jgi:amidase